MTNKSISFKRIALVLVAALGFGVMSSGPSTAYLSDTPTLSLSASSATIAAGETATVTATVSFTSDRAGESLSVLVDSATNNASPVWFGLTADSVNVLTGNGNDGPEEARFFKVGPTAGNPDSFVAATGAGMHIPTNATDGTLKAVTAKATLNVRTSTALASTSAQSFTYTVTLRQVYNGVTTNLKTATFTVNVSAIDTTATAGKSLLWVNKELSTTNAGLGGTATSISADSALVVSAGTASTSAQSYTNVGGIWADFRNASDTNITGPLGNRSNVDGTITLNVSGPGALSKTGAFTTYVKSITLSRGDTAMIWADGTAGTMTISGYIGGTALTQAVKTVTFTGKAATLTAYETTVIQMGAPSLSSNAADSVNVGNKVMYVQAKDSAGNTVRTGALNANANLWCISSDTTVASVKAAVGADAAASTLSYVAATAPSSAETFWTCNVRPLKEGTATITLADDTVVATASLSAGKTFTFAKSVGGTAAGFKGKGTISFNKATYNVGEKAEITVTVVNAAGNVPGAVLTTGDAAGTVFTSVAQNRPFSSVGRGTANAALGFGSDREGLSFTLTGGTFFKGVETYVVYMPTTAGDVTITGFTTDGTNDTATAVSVTLKVVDPNAAAIAAAQAAAVAAADAATDAALEAIDAANAATDAANLAAEAADAATVAAEEARDAADAATAAVEALATEVATLMAALKAQITTLASTVAKIAKKMKA